MVLLLIDGLEGSLRPQLTEHVFVEEIGVLLMALDVALYERAQGHHHLALLSGLLEREFGERRANSPPLEAGLDFSVQ
jgi:hypothetical protein